MLAVISGRHVAKRMAVVAVIWVTLGLILTVVFSDVTFAFYGFAGAFAAAFSSVVAIKGQEAVAAGGGGDDRNGQKPESWGDR